MKKYQLVSKLQILILVQKHKLLKLGVISGLLVLAFLLPYTESFTPAYVIETVMELESQNSDEKAINNWLQEREEAYGVSNMVYIKTEHGFTLEYKYSSENPLIPVWGYKKIQIRYQ